MNISSIPAITVTSKGQVTIPVEVREHLGIKPKDRVQFEVSEDGSVTVVPARSHVLASFGVVKPRRQHEDFRALRREFEEGVAENVLRRG
jgi:antitoxin PrlF